MANRAGHTTHNFVVYAPLLVNESLHLISEKDHLFTLLGKAQYNVNDIKDNLFAMEYKASNLSRRAEKIPEEKKRERGEIFELRKKIQR